MISPIKEVVFAALQACGVTPSSKIAVAVSGGGDSLALSLLLHEFCGDGVLALTVDHGLRAGSRIEAENLSRFFAARGIRHEILSWQGEKPKTHVQERARAARYDLLLQKCKGEGICFLAVGHNLEDQAETFWMRLAHGSGVDGLSGIAAVRTAGGIGIIRPLLAIPRQSLRDFCTAENAPYVDDPSNENEKFLRVRLRGFEDVLTQEGLTPQRLVQVMGKMQDASAALVWMTGRAVKDCIVFSTDGAAQLDQAAWLHYPAEIRRRVVVHLVQAVSRTQAPPPQKYPPGFAALDALCAALAEAGFAGRTLGGCLFSACKKGRISVQLEMQDAEIKENYEDNARRNG